MIKAVCVCDICGQETSVYNGHSGPKLNLSYVGYVLNACIGDPSPDIKPLLDKSVDIDICEGCANKISKFIAQMYKNERTFHHAEKEE